jgi:hypothetical protein
VATRLRPARPEEVDAALHRLDTARAHDEALDVDDERLLVRHFLAILTERAPGRSVEVRVPPYAAVQAVPGIRHTRGTPPAVVETDAATWLDLARGRTTFDAAVADGAVRASGERSDLSGYLPLT